MGTKRSGERLIVHIGIIDLEIKNCNESIIYKTIILSRKFYLKKIINLVVCFNNIWRKQTACTKLHPLLTSQINPAISWFDSVRRR